MYVQTWTSLYTVLYIVKKYTGPWISLFIFGLRQREHCRRCCRQPIAALWPSVEAGHTRRQPYIQGNNPLHQICAHETLSVAGGWVLLVQWIGFDMVRWSLGLEANHRGAKKLSTSSSLARVETTRNWRGLEGASCLLAGHTFATLNTNTVFMWGVHWYGLMVLTSI